ncbi:MAG: hypothetical protein ACD_79C00321G0001, partial [uncultured bacterium]
MSFVLIIYLFITFIYSRNFNYNTSGFACVGEWYYSKAILGEKVFVLKNSAGYDGQFFLYMCHDLNGNSEIIKQIDVPAYRYQRIMYPLLVYLISFGQNNIFSPILILVNIISIIFTVYVLILFLRKNDMNIWYSLLYPCISGLVLCVMRDLPGPLDILFIVCAFYFYSGGKYLQSAIFLSLAFLTRETSLLLLAGFMFDILFVKKRHRDVFYFVFSAIPWALWQGYLFSQFKQLSFSGGTGNFDAPLKAFIKYVQAVFGMNDEIRLKLLFFFIGIIFIFSLIIALLEFIKNRNVYSVNFLIVAIFFLFLSDKVWVEPWSFV